MPQQLRSGLAAPRIPQAFLLVLSGIPTELGQDSVNPLAVTMTERKLYPTNLSGNHAATARLAGRHARRHGERRAVVVYWMLMEANAGVYLWA